VVRVIEGDREFSIMRKAWPTRVYFCAMEGFLNYIRDFLTHKNINKFKRSVAKYITVCLKYEYFL